MIDRECDVRRLLEEEGWLVVRAAGSKGVADLVALKAGIADPLLSTKCRLIEVKSTAQSPYERFGPAKRVALAEAARRAGGTAWIAWWPPRRPLQWIRVVDERPSDG
jgi:Holliday junction resolvase